MNNEYLTGFFEATRLYLGDARGGSGELAPIDFHLSDVPAEVEHINPAVGKVE